MNSSRGGNYRRRREHKKNAKKVKEQSTAGQVKAKRNMRRDER